jgi:hypothetical protein
MPLNRRILRVVARGWESKSVEDQIQSARARQEGPKTQLTPEQIDNQKKCDSLLLHRTRVMRDLANCTDARYHKTLSDGLAFLETQLTALGWVRSK